MPLEQPQRERLAVIVEEMEGDGIPEEEIRSYVEQFKLKHGNYPQAQAQQGGLEQAIRQANLLPVQGEEEVAGTFARLPAELAQEVSGYLPAAGGALGGLLGSGAGPGGTVGGAALGSAAGEAGQRLIRQAALASEPPSSAGEAASAIGSAGAAGALVAGAPTGAARLLRPIAGPVARGAAAAAKAYVKLSPSARAVKAGVEAAIPKGAKKALEARMTHALVRAAKETAEETPKKVIPFDRAKVGGTVEEMQDRVITWASDTGLSRTQMAEALRGIYPSDLTPSAARKVVDLILDTAKVARK